MFLYLLVVVGAHFWFVLGAVSLGFGLARWLCFCGYPVLCFLLVVCIVVYLICLWVGRAWFGLVAWAGVGG